jgi:hypothetical protein
MLAAADNLTSVLRPRRSTRARAGLYRHPVQGCRPARTVAASTGARLGSAAGAHRDQVGAALQSPIEGGILDRQTLITVREPRRPLPLRLATDLACSCFFSWRDRPGARRSVPSRVPARKRYLFMEWRTNGRRSILYGVIAPAVVQESGFEFSQRCAGGLKGQP